VERHIRIKVDKGGTDRDDGKKRREEKKEEVS
jgi:hypothetical protein